MAAVPIQHQLTDEQIANLIRRGPDAQRTWLKEQGAESPRSWIPDWNLSPQTAPRDMDRTTHTRNETYQGQSQGQDVSPYLEMFREQQERSLKGQDDMLAFRRERAGRGDEMSNRWLSLFEEQHKHQLQSQSRVNPLETILRNLGRSAGTVGQGIHRGQGGYSGSLLGRALSFGDMGNYGSPNSPMMQAGLNMSPENPIGTGRHQLMNPHDLLR